MRTTTSLWALYLLPSPPRTWGRPDLGGCTGGRGVVIDGVQVQGRVSWVQVGDGVGDARNVPPPPAVPLSSLRTLAARKPPSLLTTSWLGMSSTRRSPHCPPEHHGGCPR